MALPPKKPTTSRPTTTIGTVPGVAPGTAAPITGSIGGSMAGFGSYGSKPPTPSTAKPTAPITKPIPLAGKYGSKLR